MRTMMKSAMVLLAAMAAQPVIAQDGRRDRNSNTERFVLDYQGEHLRGNNTLKLKNKLKREHDVNLGSLVVTRVKLIAKTKGGSGTATLKMGRDESRAVTVDGNARDFRSNDASTFHAVPFRALGDGSIDQGVMQILLNGNFKVDRVACYGKVDV